MNGANCTTESELIILWLNLGHHSNTPRDYMNIYKIEYAFTMNTSSSLKFYLSLQSHPQLGFYGETSKLWITWM